MLLPLLALFAHGAAFSVCSDQELFIGVTNKGETGQCKHKGEQNSKERERSQTLSIVFTAVVPFRCLGSDQVQRWSHLAKYQTFDESDTLLESTQHILPSNIWTTVAPVCTVSWEREPPKTYSDNLFKLHKRGLIKQKTLQGPSTKTTTVKILNREKFQAATQNSCLNKALDSTLLCAF